MHSETQKELKKAEKIIGKSKKLKETKTMVDALYDEVAELRLQNEVSPTQPCMWRGLVSPCPHHKSSLLVCECVCVCVLLLPVQVQTGFHR